MVTKRPHLAEDGILGLIENIMWHLIGVANNKKPGDKHSAHLVVGIARVFMQNLWNSTLKLLSSEKSFENCNTYSKKILWQPLFLIEDNTHLRQPFYWGLAKILLYHHLFLTLRIKCYTYSSRLTPNSVPPPPS